MNAKAIVNKLLEDGFGYGQQEKPEHWTEVPYGYVAKGPDRTLTAKWDGKEYRFTVDWIDDFTGKPRTMSYGMQSVDDPEAWLAKEQVKYESAGWDFKLL